MYIVSNQYSTANFQCHLFQRANDTCLGTETLVSPLPPWISVHCRFQQYNPRLFEHGCWPDALSPKRLMRDVVDLIQPSDSSASIADATGSMHAQTCEMAPKFAFRQHSIYPDRH